MTRRSLIRRALVFSIAVAIYPLMPGCQRFQDVVAEVDKWVGAGLSTFASIVKILQSLGVVIPGGTLVNTLVGLVPQIISDALQGITNAIAAYNNAPAAQKANLEGQIATAIQAAIGAIQTFWSQLNLPDASTAQLIEGIISVALSTLAYFGTMMPATAGFKLPPQGMKVIAYSPQRRSLAQYKTDVNRYFTGPYAQYAVK